VAQLAAVRGDHEGVRRALEPLLDIAASDGIEEPGFWPWQDLYADALVGLGRVAEADVFLRPHETLAAERGRCSMIAKLARVRGRLEGARGRVDEAEAAFQDGLGRLQSLSMPFELALVELAYGQLLRRSGRRRAAADRIRDAQARLVGLDARSYLACCDQELAGCGLAPAQRRNHDRVRLTPQEVAVAKLVCAGLSNREVAAELVVSIKTVEFHLRHAYQKLGVASRTKLVARSREFSDSSIRP
jgi:ATP/maltotriose-dependent transcriptional regulator MalT